MAYEAVIGLEVHAELLTQSKMFCGCAVVDATSAAPNTVVCPVCAALPGALPVLNARAVEYALRVALALNCAIPSINVFARKNYFYPDLPKGYQISQYGESPIGVRGWVEIETPESGIKRIGIRRVHLEEDTGKLLHSTPDSSEIDYNRSSVPLMEIVTEHDPRAGFDQINSAAEAREYIVRLRAILTYLGVCDGKMEEGSLRCEPNISVRPVGSTEYGTRTELKNLNSFRAVYRGLEYEIERQINALKSGEKIVHETRRWDDENEVTVTMRGKELEQEYRYFPEPDLLPFCFSSEQIDAIRSQQPELPLARKRRFVELGLSEADAVTLTDEKTLSDWFDKAVNAGGDPRVVCNWVIGDLTKLLNNSAISIQDCKITPGSLVEMIKLINDGTISGKIAKSVFEEMFVSGKSASEIVESTGQTQISDKVTILAAVRQVITENERIANDFREGKEKALGFLVGQVMKHTNGRANPKLVNDLLRQELK